MMYPTLIIASLALFSVVAWKKPHYGLYLICGLLPSYLLRFDILGIPTTLLEMMIVLLVGIWLAVKRPRINSIIPKAWQKPVVFFLASGAVAAWISPNTLDALGVFKSYILLPVLLFIVAVDLLRTHRHKRNVTRALGASGLFVALFGIFQFMSGQAIPIPWDIERRITSVYPFPNAVGLFLGPIIVLGVFAFINTLKKTRWALFWAFVVLLGGLAVVLAKSEAVLVAVPATLFVSGVVSERLRKRTLIAAGVTALLIAVSPWNHIAWQKLTLQDTSGQVRISQWQETAQLLRDQPVFGAGLSGYPAAIAPYHTAREYEIFQYPHNILLNFWVEMGMIGLIAVSWVLTRALRMTKTYLKHPKRHWLPLAATAAIIEMGIHGLVDVPYFKNDLSVLTWVLIAVMISGTHAKRNRDKKEQA
jgi:O-antigen ligase